jgi:hypothetical protein
MTTVIAELRKRNQKLEGQQEELVKNIKTGGRRTDQTPLDQFYESQRLTTHKVELDVSSLLPKDITEIRTSFNSPEKLRGTKKASETALNRT